MTSVIRLFNKQEGDARTKFCDATSDSSVGTEAFKKIPVAMKNMQEYASLALQSIAGAGIGLSLGGLATNALMYCYTKGTLESGEATPETFEFWFQSSSRCTHLASEAGMRIALWQYKRESSPSG